MTRSITAKLVLAFLVVSITVVALASGITYWLTVREFKQLVFNQARDRFVADATLYYQVQGSWDGALAYFNLREAFPQPFGPGPGPENSAIRDRICTKYYGSRSIRTGSNKTRPGFHDLLPVSRCQRQSTRSIRPIPGRRHDRLDEVIPGDARNR